MNIYLSYTLYINTYSTMWCYSEHSAPINLRFCDSTAAVRPLQRAVKAFLTSNAPLEDRLNDPPLTFVLAWWDTSVSMMMLCSTQIHLTNLSVLLMFVSIALFHNHHFAVRIPNAYSTHLLAHDGLQLKTRSSYDISFLAKTSLGMSLEDKPHPQGWWKAFLFHFPQNLQALVRYIPSLPRSI